MGLGGGLATPAPRIPHGLTLRAGLSGCRQDQAFAGPAL